MRTDWTERLANLSIVATQVLTCLLIADALGWKPLEKLQEIPYRFRQWEFELYYKYLHKVQSIGEDEPCP